MNCKLIYLRRDEESHFVRPIFWASNVFKPSKPCNFAGFATLISKDQTRSHLESTNRSVFSVETGLSSSATSATVNCGHPKN